MFSPTEVASPPSLDSLRYLQRQYHDVLVSDGGRPCYPIALLDDFSENPTTYPTLAHPWAFENEWEVFHQQVRHWHDFLRWQLHWRGLYDFNTEYVRYVNTFKIRWSGYKRDRDAAKFEADPLYLMPYWKSWQEQYKVDWKYISPVSNIPPRLSGQTTFNRYFEGVKLRLAQHGLTRTFQLHEDVQQQDKLTTWIEYLAFEYAWCDRYTRLAKRRQPEYDAAWKKLMDSGALRDGETMDYLYSDEGTFSAVEETTQLFLTFQSAEAAVDAALAETEKLEDGNDSLAAQECRRRLAEARCRFTAASEAYEAIVERDGHISRFMGEIGPYLETEREVTKHEEHAQWILDQLPLVEAELSEDRNLETGPSPAQSSPVSRPAAQRTPTPQPARDAGRKTRSGRVTKKPAQRGTDARSPRSESARAGASPPSGPRPRRLDPESNTGVGSVVQPRKGQRKVYQKERASRRLAGQLPEFGMLPDRGEPAPLVEAPLHDSPRTGTTRKPAPRGKKMSQAQAGSGAKPRGVSKSRPRSLRQGIRRSLA